MTEISIDNLINTKNVSVTKQKVKNLLEQNLLEITSLSSSSFVLPINLQSILCLLISYTYQIPIITFISLYQLYANDLLVIAMTILNSKHLETSIIEDSKQLLEALNSGHGKLSDSSKPLYNILKHNIYENKIYIPSNLW